MFIRRDMSYDDRQNILMFNIGAKSINSYKYEIRYLLVMGLTKYNGKIL